MYMENDYIIGAEKNLQDVLQGIDLTPILESAVGAGAFSVAVIDSDGHILCSFGDHSAGDIFSVKKPLYLEGEITGNIVVTGSAENISHVKALGEMIFYVLKAVIQSSFKALLAAETHKTVVHQSYDELLETNRKLQLSENKYRELANNLEIEVQKRTAELKQAHAKLLQQEKIASVGQLAAGVAHEINNPLSFIVSNMNTCGNYVAKLRDMLLFYRDAFQKAVLTKKERDMSRQLWNKKKLDYILSDIDELIHESLAGAKRVEKIVSDLKGFSHIDEADEVDVNINEEIDRTFNVLTHEIPGDAEIIKDYGDLPAFTCNPAYLCQAFLNIVLNAVQARKQGLNLSVTTLCKDGFISVAFSDNGPGIPEAIKDRVFEPFFTTKDIGKGTGMGLHVTYETVSLYGGTIELESRPQRGTTFNILLPVQKGN